jgi:hypothetical protein
MDGYVYVLFDAYASRCKIGRTGRLGGQRQREIMAAHPVRLVNVVTARVTDCVTAERQCHRHFAAYRTNGEWFAVNVADVVSYVHGDLEWSEIDFANPATISRYIVAARLVTGQASNLLPSPRAVPCARR